MRGLRGALERELPGRLVGAVGRRARSSATRTCASREFLGVEPVLVDQRGIAVVIARVDVTRCRRCRRSLPLVGSAASRLMSAAERLEAAIEFVPCCAPMKLTVLVSGTTVPFGSERAASERQADGGKQRFHKNEFVHGYPQCSRRDDRLRFIVSAAGVGAEARACELELSETPREAADSGTSLGLPRILRDQRNCRGSRCLHICAVRRHAENPECGSRTRLCGYAAPRPDSRRPRARRRPGGGVSGSASTAGDWPSYNRDLAGTRFSPLAQIDAAQRRRPSADMGVPARAQHDHGQALRAAPSSRRSRSTGRHVRDRRRTASSRCAPTPARSSGDIRSTQGLPSRRGLAYWPGDERTRRGCISPPAAR